MENFELFRSLSDPELSTFKIKSQLREKLSEQPETVFESIESSSCSSSFNFIHEETTNKNHPQIIPNDDSPSDLRRPSEEMISLSHIRESKVMHKYTASRGQREREVEWCELVPIRMVVKNTKRIVRVID